MAFVSVPKDLSKVKTKVALNLTLRQLVSFSIGAIIGIPVYWYTRTTVGNDIAVFFMILCVLPFFFCGVFEKDGIVFEKYMSYIIKQKFIYPKVRIYKTENFYEYLDKGDEREVVKREKSKTEKPRKSTDKKSKGIKSKPKAA
jgi:hypothetical protein